MQYSVQEICDSFHAFAVSKKPKFEINYVNQPVIKQLALYFYNHPEGTLNKDKGIYLCGPVGTGKTTLMRLFSEWSSNKFRFVSCRDIQQEFAREGFEILLKYTKKSYHYKGGNHSPSNGPITYCFDDFGSEGNSMFYGNKVMVMEEVIQDRYNEFETFGMITHATSNLKSGILIEETYGIRVRDRIRGMFNIVELNGVSFRK